MHGILHQVGKSWLIRRREYFRLGREKEIGFGGVEGGGNSPETSENAFFEVGENGGSGRWGRGGGAKNQEIFSEGLGNGLPSLIRPPLPQILLLSSPL